MFGLGFELGCKVSECSAWFQLRSWGHYGLGFRAFGFRVQGVEFRNLGLG